MNNISGSSMVFPEIKFSMLKYLLSYGSGKNSRNSTNCFIYTWHTLSVFFSLSKFKKFNEIKSSGSKYFLNS